MTRPICSATKTNGDPCRAVCQPNRPFCFSHDPELADRRSAGRIAGGRERSNARRAFRKLPGDIQSTLDVLFRALHGLEDSSVEPQVANALANVSRAVCTVWEAGQLESRLEALESKVNTSDPSIREIRKGAA